MFLQSWQLTTPCQPLDKRGSIGQRGWWRQRTSKMWISGWCRKNSPWTCLSSSGACWEKRSHTQASTCHETILLWWCCKWYLLSSHTPAPRGLSTALSTLSGPVAWVGSLHPSILCSLTGKNFTRGEATGSCLRSMRLARFKGSGGTPSVSTFYNLIIYGNI